MAIKSGRSPIFSVHHDGTDARMNEVGALVVAGLQLVARTAVGPVGAGNGRISAGCFICLATVGKYY